MNFEQRPPPRRPFQWLSCRDDTRAHRDRCRLLFSASASGIPFPCCPQPAQVKPLGEQSLQEWSTETMRTGGLPGMLTLVPCRYSCFAGRRWWLGSNRPGPSINERCPKERQARSGAGVHGAQLGLSVSHDRLGRVDDRLALSPKTGARQALIGHLTSTS